MIKKQTLSGDMHQSQKHLILRRTLQALWQHVFLLLTTEPVFFPLLASVSQSVVVPALTCPYKSHR